METNTIIPHRILVVDDEQPILFAMSEYFRPYGYKVDCAQKLAEAQVFLSKTYYPVIILDLRLTGRSDTEGLELVSYARARYAKTRVIVLTANGSSEIKRKCHARGVDVFLIKPRPLPEVAQIVFGLVEEES